MGHVRHGHLPSVAVMMKMMRHPLVLETKVASAHCALEKRGVSVSHGHKWVSVPLSMRHVTAPVREANLLLGRSFRLISVACSVLVASVCASVARAHEVELAKTLVAGSLCVEAVPSKGSAPAS